MKILTKEEEDEHYRATVNGALKGAVLGLGVSLGVSLVAQQRAGLNYERKRYGYYQPAKELHQTHSTVQVAKEFISENRYSIVCGTGLSISSKEPKAIEGSDKWKEMVAAEERKMNK
ncbi:3871_t:CDS:2, partial [Racocetra fulgida]